MSHLIESDKTYSTCSPVICAPSQVTNIAAIINPIGTRLRNTKNLAVSVMFSPDFFKMSPPVIMPATAPGIITAPGDKKIIRRIIIILINKFLERIT